MRTVPTHSHPRAPTRKQVEKAAERAAEKDAAEAEEQAQAEVDLRVAASRGDKAALAIAEQAEC